MHDLGEALSADLWTTDRPRGWVNGRHAPDGVVMWRMADWHLENRPSTFKKGIALCESILGKFKHFGYMTWSSITFYS